MPMKQQKRTKAGGGFAPSAEVNFRASLLVFTKVLHEPFCRDAILIRNLEKLRLE
jgi:hypothetical protein